MGSLGRDVFIVENTKIIIYNVYILFGNIVWLQLYKNIDTMDTTVG
jgi:hypothetical protein